MIVADVDGDGYLDVAAADFDELRWYENDGSATVWISRVVSASSGWNLETVEPADINSDGHIDLVYAGSLTSSILTADYDPQWRSLSWQADIHTGNSVFFQVRGSSDSTDMGAWSDTIMLPCSLLTVLADNDTFFQYKTILKRVDDTTIPVLNDVSVSYTRQPTGVPEDVYLLFDAFPNPSSSCSMLRFQIPLAGQVKISVYDMTGRVVDTPFDISMDAGIHSVWLPELDPGVYLLRIESGSWSETGRFVIVED
jgi:hypothetical protein